MHIEFNGQEVLVKLRDLDNLESQAKEAYKDIRQNGWAHLPLRFLFTQEDPLVCLEVHFKYRFSEPSIQELSPFEQQQLKERFSSI